MSKFLLIVGLLLMAGGIILSVFLKRRRKTMEDPV